MPAHNFTFLLLVQHVRDFKKYKVQFAYHKIFKLIEYN